MGDESRLDLLRIVLPGLVSLDIVSRAVSGDPERLQWAKETLVNVPEIVLENEYPDRFLRQFDFEFVDNQDGTYEYIIHPRIQLKSLLKLRHDKVEPFDEDALIGHLYWSLVDRFPEDVGPDVQETFDERLAAYLKKKSVHKRLNEIIGFMGGDKHFKEKFLVDSILGLCRFVKEKGNDELELECDSNVRSLLQGFLFRPGGPEARTLGRNWDRRLRFGGPSWNLFIGIV